MLPLRSGLSACSCAASAVAAEACGACTLAKAMPRFPDSAALAPVALPRLSAPLAVLLSTAAALPTWLPAPNVCRVRTCGVASCVPCRIIKRHVSSRRIVKRFHAIMSVIQSGQRVGTWLLI